jgi:hypothetical protein
MRFRPANISLINRRHYLPRLLLTLFSKGQMQKPPQRFEDVDRVTPYQGRVADDTFRSELAPQAIILLLPIIALSPIRKIASFGDSRRPVRTFRKATSSL